MKFNKQFIIDFTQPFSFVQTFEYVLDDAFWRLVEAEDIESGNVIASVTVTPIKGIHKLSFNFKGSVTVPCDRCLAPYEQLIDSLEEVDVEIGDAFDDTDDTVIVLDGKAPKLDLSWLMYEMVALSMPIQRMHDLSDCDQEMLKYLVGSVGEEIDESATEDPRWGSLREAMKTKENSNN